MAVDRRPWYRQTTLLETLARQTLKKRVSDATAGGVLPGLVMHSIVGFVDTCDYWPRRVSRLTPGADFLPSPAMMKARNRVLRKFAKTHGPRQQTLRKHVEQLKSTIIDVLKQEKKGCRKAGLLIVAELDDVRKRRGGW